MDSRRTMSHVITSVELIIFFQTTSLTRGNGKLCSTALHYKTPLVRFCIHGNGIGIESWLPPLHKFFTLIVKLYWCQLRFDFFGHVSLMTLEEIPFWNLTQFDKKTLPRSFHIVRSMIAVWYSITCSQWIHSSIMTTQITGNSLVCWTSC